MLPTPFLPLCPLSQKRFHVLQYSTFANPLTHSSSHTNRTCHMEARSNDDDRSTVDIRVLMEVRLPRGCLTRNILPTQLLRATFSPPDQILRQLGHGFLNVEISVSQEPLYGRKVGCFEGRLLNLLHDLLQGLQSLPAVLLT